MNLLSRFVDSLIFLIAAVVCLAGCMAIVTAVLWLMFVVGYAVLKFLNSFIV